MKRLEDRPAEGRGTVGGLGRATVRRLARKGGRIALRSVHRGGLDYAAKDSEQAGTMTSTAVAEILVRSIENSRLRAMAGREAYAAAWSKRNLPVRTQELIARRMQGGVGS